jgi:hypothetical protein
MARENSFFFCNFCSEGNTSTGMTMKGRQLEPSYRPYA